MLRSRHLFRLLAISAAGLLLTNLKVAAQTVPSAKTPIAPGFLMRDNGVIDIGHAYAEINYYDNKWTIAQQHDRFTVDGPAEKSSDGQIKLKGTLATAAAPVKVIETITPMQGGFGYAASFDAGHPLESNELGLALILPLSDFGGKQLHVDGKVVDLPMTPAAKGKAVLFTNDAVHELKVPTPKGELSLSGKFAVKLNDDREWNDPRFSLRLLFTPGTGSIQTSNIDLKIMLQPAP